MSRCKLLYPPILRLGALGYDRGKGYLGKASEAAWDIERTLQSTRRIGYLAVACFSAAACPKAIEGATLTFRTYRIASVIITLSLAPPADETRQKCLALLSFSLKLTPFKIKRSWKKKSLWIGRIISDFVLLMHSELLNPC